MLQRLLPLVFLSLISLSAAAQLGSIQGQVIDLKTNESIIGANVVIEGTTVGAATDIDGNFSIANIKPGTYNVVVSFITYKTQTIPAVVVEAGNKTSLKITLVEDVAELEAVVVTAQREISTDLSLINSIRESKLVVSGISAEQISRVPDKDAAQIMQRVSGISIVDNRFVMIRGVNERYNQVMINGMIAPSTEVDKRSFSFDLIPSAAIGQILIYKSGNADMPGDFAGGVIRVVTKEATSDYMRINLSSGFRAGTTFNDFSRTNRSSTDILGFDNGFRGLPSSFPSTTVLANTAVTDPVRLQAGQSLENNFDYTTRNAPLDMGIGLELSKEFDLGNWKVGSLTNLSYSNSYQTKSVTFNRYIFDANSINARFDYNDTYNENDVRINALTNWYAQKGNTKLEFKNLFNVLGEDQTILREGRDLFLYPDRNYRNYAYHYQSRMIYTGQLQGTHKFANNSLILDWVGGYNYVHRDEPDFRRFRTFYDASSGEQNYQVQLPSNTSPTDAGRFYSDLTDRGYSHGLNVEKKFGDAESKRLPSIKAGYYIESKNRDFSARYLSYNYPSFFSSEEQEHLVRLPIGEIFSPVNIRSQDGLVISEGTRPTDTYRGTNLLTAGYLMGVLPVGKFDITGGVRVENNIQKIRTSTPTGPVEIDNPILSVLPSLNAAYNLSERSLVRVAYSRTVNRPEFRELAPFLFYDFENEQGIQGKLDLKTASIDNVDVRWEMYPNAGEAISIGGFYKAFRNPIESIMILTTESPQSTFGNADYATAYGAELEFKKSLASLGVSKFLRNTAVNLNTSWIFSQVDLGSQATSQQRVRQLQGQSPYLVNLGLYYNDDETGFSTAIAYNVFGPRIHSVGDVNFPSIYELSRNSLDLQIAKQFGRFDAKLNIQNLLNAAYRYYQDTDVDNKITIDGDRDRPIQLYKVGQQVSLSLSYRVFGD